MTIDPDWITLITICGVALMVERRLTKVESALKRVMAHLFPNEDHNLG